MHLRFKRHSISLCLLYVLASSAQQSANPLLPNAIDEGKRIFARLGGGPTLEERIAQSTSAVNVQLIRNTSVPVFEQPSTSDQTLLPSVRAIGNLSDRVVLGRVVKNVSAKTENHKFLFSVSQLKIEEDFKPDKSTSEEEPLVLWPGGQLLISGRHVVASVSDSKPLLPDHEYILFLTRTTSVGVYKLEGTESFDLTEGVATPLEPRNSRVPHASATSRSAFINAVRHSIQMGGAK